MDFGCLMKQKWDDYRIIQKFKSMNLFTNKWLHTIFACSIICCTPVYADKNKTKSRTPGFLFSESDRLLVGELPVSVVPLREEVMKAGLSRRNCARASGELIQGESRTGAR